MATVFTIFKGFVATAILFMPYAFVEAGYGFSGISLLVSLLLNLISIHKLLQVYKAVGGGSLSELGEKSVGKFGKVLTDILLFFSQLSFCLAYVYFIAQQVGGTFILCVTNTAADEVSCPADKGLDLTIPPWKWMWIGVCMLLFTPLVWLRKTEKLAFTHIFADIMVGVGLIMITVFASKEISKNGGV